jgi:hypothetical protein
LKFFRLHNLFLLAVIFLIFMAPAIWNGFPLIFTDSLSYLTSGVELVAPVDRPIFYGLFIRISNLLIDLWGLVLLQTTLVIYLLLRLADSLFPDLSKKIVLLWIIAVGIMTSAPWFVSQISADIFTSCLFLTIIILALICERASLGNIILLGGLMIFEICMHSANLLIGLTLFLYIIGLSWQQRKSWVYIKKFALISMTSFVISIAAIVASNVIFDQGFTFNRWGKVIFLARILEDGPGLRYLNDVCTTKNLKTCTALPLFNEAAKREVELGIIHNPELKNLVLNALLWDGGINTIGGLSNVNDEASSIIHGSMKAYPMEMISAFINNTFDQFRTFSVGNQFGSTSHIVAINYFFKANFPASNQSYIDSHQYEGGVKVITSSLNVMYRLIIYLSSFMIIVLVFYSSKTQSASSSVRLVILSLIVFLITNAMITGGISAIFDRYQSRVIWLLPAIIFLCLIDIVRRQYKRAIPNF